MSKTGSRKRRFNKTLFCLYQSTSDDLMFWCWFDVLILSMNYGFDMTQISLLFSVAFWVALAVKAPANALAKKLGAARCVLLSAAMFLSAALLLTFGSTLVVAIIGQSIYLVAGSFQEMATVIAKKAAESRTQRAAPSFLARAFAGTFMAKATQKDTEKSSDICVMLNP